MKIATLEDFDEIKEMAMKFATQTSYAEYMNETTISDLIGHILSGEKNTMIILLEPGVGFLAGMSAPFMFGPYLVASEVAWWINEDKRGSGVGKDLVEAFEYWAKEKAGCKMVTMSCLDDSVGKFYEKNGYKLHERAYMKVL